MFTLSNQELSIRGSHASADRQSLRDLRNDRECLWQGDARWWNGHSPILFPITGGLWNGTCRTPKGEIQIPKHGFVRRRNWRLAEQTDAALRFEYIGSVGDYALFPWAFRLSATYSLEGRSLRADFEVENLGGEDLWFQLGGHPALNLPDWRDEEPLDGFLRLEGKPESLIRAGEQGCQEPERHPVPLTDDGLVALGVETFAHEALIFDGAQISAATLLDRTKQPVARVESDAPVWLFWSPQGQHSPFVCAEPWYGLCDPIGYEGPVDERPFIQCARGGEKWHGYFKIDIL